MAIAHGIPRRLAGGTARASCQPRAPGLSLGYAYHHLGQYGESLACYRQSLDLFRELTDRSTEAEILTHLGDAYLDGGDPGQARDAWQQALNILDDLQHPGVDELRAKLRAADGVIHGGKTGAVPVLRR
jgi:tetratricopeptide (TPR) repeat protein